MTKYPLFWQEAGWMITKYLRALGILPIDLVSGEERKSLVCPRDRKPLSNGRTRDFRSSPETRSMGRIPSARRYLDIWTLPLVVVTVNHFQMGLSLCLSTLLLQVCKNIRW